MGCTVGINFIGCMRLWGIKVDRDARWGSIPSDVWGFRGRTGNTGGII